MHARPFAPSWIVAALCALALSPASFADAIDDYIHAEMERQKIPGLALAVVVGGDVVKMRGYGFANVESSAPVREDTVFRLASISKQFIATAVIRLVIEGRLALDDRVDEYLEDAPETWAPITVRHLLTHTSGLRQEAPGFDGLADQRNEDLVRNAYGVPVLFEPGERFAYSNLGYYVLAGIIEKAAGKPWANVVTETVFAPLAMTATRTTSLRDIVPNRAAGYIVRDGTLINAPPLITLRASGAFLSSIADMVKWDAALAKRRVVPSAVQETMWTPATLKGGSSTQYGFGWWIDDVRGYRRIRHGGTNPGYAAEYSHFIDEALSVIVLTNGGCARPDAMALDIADGFMPGLSPSRRPISLDRQTLAKYAGRYRFASNDTITIEVDGNGLSVQGDTPAFSSQCTMLPESPTTFFITRDESYVFSLESGVVTGLVVAFGGQQVAAARIR